MSRQSTRWGGVRCRGLSCREELYPALFSWVPIVIVSGEFNIATRSGEMSFSRVNMSLRNCSAMSTMDCFLVSFLSGEMEVGLPRRTWSSQELRERHMRTSLPDTGHVVGQLKSPKRTRHPRG
ncbi:hypothetical protein BDV34DRAFT_196431 [Aspergillus parasiticus]|uniref:Uncharacterized protein n=1 Tax=Aspergillus parasiticus TaxID=5067 RepID=A0A5N6DIX4_ASPPA|nr:hypothetical protein BDV34DRAFT_196431 [Aspergillus parasiticus]